MVFNDSDRMPCVLEAVSEEGLGGKGRETGRKVNTPRNENLTEEKHTVAGFRSFPRLLWLSHRRLISERGSRKKEEGPVLQAQDSKPVMMLRTQRSVPTAASGCQGASCLFPVLSRHQCTSDVDHSCTRFHGSFSSSSKTFNTC